MQNVQGREPRVLEAALLKLLELVGGEVLAVLVLAPVVAFGKTTDRKTLLGDRLPVLALRPIRERNSPGDDGEDQICVRVSLLLARSQARDADFLAPFLDWVCLKEAKLGAFADRLGRLLGCS